MAISKVGRWPTLVRVNDPGSGEQPVLNIVGELVALGPLRRDLLPLYQRWINDFAAASRLGSFVPLTLEQEESWYDSVIKSEKAVTFTVYERKGVRPIGTTGLTDIDQRNRRAEFGIFIGEPECRGKGYGTELCVYRARLTQRHAAGFRVQPDGHAGLRESGI